MKSCLSVVAGVLLALPVFSQIQLSFEKTDPSCFSYTNGIAIVNASGGQAPYTYHWQNGLTYNQYWGIPAGTYFVTVTDAAGASAVGSVTLNHPDLMVVGIDAVDVQCVGYNGHLDAKPVGGTAPYNYAWSNGQTSQKATNITAGDWMVTVLDSHGCHDVGTRFVDVPSQIFPNLVPTNPICFTDHDGQIVANVFGNHPPFSFQWSSGSISNMATELTQGTYQVTITDQNGCQQVISQSLTSNPAFTVNVQTTNVTCKNQHDGAVGADAQGGVPPYISYFWTKDGQPVGSQPILQNVAPGNYAVTVVDNAGCEAYGTGVVTEPDSLHPTITITPTPTGGIVNITVTGGNPPYLMTLDGVQITSTTLNLPFKNYYYLCVKDSKGCQKDVPFKIVNTACITAQLLTNSSSCAGQNNGQATVVIQNGSGNFHFQWSPNAPQQNVMQQTGLAAGTYSVTVTDLTLNCTAVATGIVDVHTNIIVDVTKTDPTCASNQDGTASATAFNGVQPYNYLWNTGSTTQNLTNLNIGAYAVTVTDAVGCTQIGSTSLVPQTPVNAAFSVHFDNCVGDSIAVSFTNNSTVLSQIVSSVWTFAQGPLLSTFNGTTPPVQNFPKNDAITVQLVVTTANGCTDLESLPVAIPSGPDFTIPQNLSDCKPVVIPITATGTGNTFAWSPTTGLDLTNPLAPIASQSGTYSVTMTNAAGCTAVKQITVVITPAFSLSAQEIPVNICDSKATLTATAAGSPTIVWTFLNGTSAGPNGTTLHLTGLSGTQTVIATATDAANCVSKDTVVVVSSPINVSLQGDGTLCKGDTATLSVQNANPTDSLTFSWNPIQTGNPSSISISTAQVGEKMYCVTVTNQGGCKDTLCQNVKVSQPIDLDTLISMSKCNGLDEIFVNHSGVPGVWNFGDGKTSTLDSLHHQFPAAGNYTVTFTPTPAVDCIPPFSELVTILNGDVLTALFTDKMSDSCSTTTQLFLAGNATPSGANTHWNWNFGTLTPPNSTTQNDTLTISQNGSYPISLIVTNSLGCMDTVSKIIKVENLFTPPIPFLTDKKFCPNEQVALNPTGDATLHYDWSAPLPDIPNPIVSPTDTTIYTVLITKGTGPDACSFRDTVKVTPNPLATLAVPADLTVCANDPIVLTATSTNATVFTWSTSPTFNPAIPGGADGTIDFNPAALNHGITLFVRANGPGDLCPTVDSLTILNGTVNISANPAIDPINLCKGGSATFSIENLDNPFDQLTYVWSPTLPPTASQTVSPTTNTTYQVTATNQFGCTATESFDVKVLDLQPQLSVMADKNSLCLDETAQLFATMNGMPGNFTFHWEPSATLDFDNIQNPIASPKDSTLYSVTVTNDLGCTATGSIYIRYVNLLCDAPYIFLPNAFTPFDGNNENSILYVRGMNIRKLEFVIYDRWGEKVFETTDPNIGWDGTFRGERLTADAYGYILKAECVDGKSYKKQGNVTLLR